VSKGQRTDQKHTLRTRRRADGDGAGGDTTKQQKPKDSKDLSKTELKRNTHRKGPQIKLWRKRSRKREKRRIYLAGRVSLLGKFPTGADFGRCEKEGRKGRCSIVLVLIRLTNAEKKGAG